MELFMCNRPYLKKNIDVVELSPKQGRAETALPPL